jgi:hypothetical protein
MALRWQDLEGGVERDVDFAHPPLAPSYHPSVAAPLARDTSAEVEQIQIEGRLGVLLLGDELARKVYPDLAALDRP